MSAVTLRLPSTISWIRRGGTERRTRKFYRRERANRMRANEKRKVKNEKRKRQRIGSLAPPFVLFVPFLLGRRQIDAHGFGAAALGVRACQELELGLANALRSLARDRVPLTVLLARGGAGEVRISGVIDRVGRDFLDLAVTPPGEARRASNVVDVATVPFGSLLALRSMRSGEL